MRTETKTYKIYKYEELSDEAKEKAREWFREGNLNYEWWDCVYDDFQEICSILGFIIHQKPQPGKGTTPAIYFSGFWSQGDGASFEADYEYKKGSVKAIKAYAPKDTELHTIAENLKELQRINFYRLEAVVKQRSNHYVHENTMYLAEIYHYDGYHLTHDAEDTFIDLARDLAHWLYNHLEKEYEYLNSDEQVEESIIINGYEFTADGQIY